MRPSQLIGYVLMAALVALHLASPAWAHRSWCHAEHSCPTEHGTYTCGDFGDCSECDDNAYCTDRRLRADHPPLTQHEARRKHTVEAAEVLPPAPLLTPDSGNDSAIHDESVDSEASGGQPRVGQGMDEMAKKLSEYKYVNGASIRALRESLGQTQTEFWSRFGVTQSGGSRYESGRTLPAPLVMLINIAHGTEAQSNAIVRRLREPAGGSAP